MPTVIPVKFRYATRDLWFDPGQSEALEGDHVICATERGTEIGLATADPVEMDDARLRQTIGDAQLKGVLRVADDADLARAEQLADAGEQAFPVFRRLVAASGLDMKPVGVEFLFGGGKAVCYFSADERVDFRQLVRDLSRELHERIDMRQIGVREEAAIVGGYAHCGQELCCARFGRQFEPVSIRMAKEQDLPLNSSKISGACGRLMCCLRYEFEAYRDFKGRAPKRNAVIDTPLGKGKIIEYDTPKEQICLRLENGKQVRVALADMQASDAARQKSEELGCPCRPDTVTREALDKLESPEIKMALAELDRQNGILPVEAVDEADLFVRTKSRRRRRRGGGEDEAPASARTSEQAQEAPSGEGASSGRSRRRRRKTAAPAPEAASAPASASDAPADAGTSRRRRRHHTADAPPAGAASAPAASQPSDGTAKASQPKRRRRPGDKGGAAGRPEERQKPAPKHQAPVPADQQHADPASGEGEAKRRRRRRRRSGRGKAGADESGSQPPAPQA